jgi:hypothetical protein
VAADYVYGVTWATSGVKAASGGVGDALVRTAVFRDVAAVTSPVASLPIRARRRELTRHSDVIAAAFRQGTVVPLRFGTVVRDADAVVADFLEPRYDDLVGLLRQLDGLGELRVRAFYREEAILAEIVASDARIARLRELTRSLPDAAGHGARLELGELVSARLAALAEADARAVVDELGRLARDVVVEERLIELEVVRASFLVDLAELPRFDAQIDALARREEARTRFTYVGPLAPHSFVAFAEET